MASKEITYDVVEEIAVLSTKGSWALELNKVSWNGAPAVYDIRKWNEDHSRMSKGITLDANEMKTLLRAMSEEEEDE